MTGTQRKKNNSLVKISNTTSRLIKFEQYNEGSNVVRFQEFHVPSSRSNIPSTTGIPENDTTTTDISLIQSFEKPTDCKIESNKREQT